MRAVCIRIPGIGNVPAWLILVIILLVFATVAHVIGMTTDVIVLLITTVTTAALQLFGIPSTKQHTFAAGEPRQAQ
ncbi:hypothetical protein [Nonomuraea sp. NPDC003709]|uniref:hypothetical protein n=1 Tax=unclassified Nonomuraea TaxID=2593643 RepID=UPI0033BEC014